jgi:hypothetical protein
MRTFYLFLFCTLVFFGCKKNNKDPYQPSLNYTVTDTDGLKTYISAYSTWNDNGTPGWIQNGGTNINDKPVVHIDRSAGIYNFVLSDGKDDKNDVQIWAPDLYNYHTKVQASQGAPVIMVVYNGAVYAAPGFDNTREIEYTTNIDDDKAKLLSGTFSVTITTAAGKLLTLSGNFKNAVLYN